MFLTFRWFGTDDPVPLGNIRQIPGITGVVSALYDVPIGDAWPRARVDRLASTVHEADLALSVIESIPVHEDIKLGRPTRDRLIDNYAQSIRAIGAAGVRVLCYNFMPVFDWMRSWFPATATRCLTPMPSSSAFCALTMSTMVMVGKSGPHWCPVAGLRCAGLVEP